MSGWTGNLDMDPKEWMESLFEDENCPECGQDAKSHWAIPFEGNWFAACAGSPLLGREDAKRSKIWKAAIRLEDGRVFMGKDHQEAFEVGRSVEPNRLLVSRAETGFVTERGAWVAQPEQLEEDSCPGH